MAGALRVCVRRMCGSLSFLNTNFVRKGWCARPCRRMVDPPLLANDFVGADVVTYCIVLDIEENVTVRHLTFVQPRTGHVRSSVN